MLMVTLLDYDPTHFRMSLLLEVEFVRCRALRWCCMPIVAEVAEVQKTNRHVGLDDECQL